MSSVAPAESARPAVERWSRIALTWAVGAVFDTSARLGARLPMARPQGHGVMVDKDIAYRDTGETAHLLDVYRPTEASGPLPVVLYIHGGGFRILSKDTHWVVALEYARRGYVVFNINYRLAPAHPYPAAAEDACAAYRWVVENAATYGGDPSRIVVAGESAGANLTMAVVAAACYARPEPWARAVYDLNVRPRAAVPACGILQVSDPRRFQRLGLSNRVSQPVIDACYVNYVGGSHQASVAEVDAQVQDVGLADPLRIIETTPPDHPLPACYVPVGTADPLLDDSRRLAEAVQKHGGVAHAAYFPRMEHAFHVWVMRPAARQCWAETEAFLDTHVHGR